MQGKETPAHGQGAGAAWRRAVELGLALSILVAVIGGMAAFYGLAPDTLLYDSVDARGYAKYASWIAGHEEFPKYYVWIRPLGYPLFLAALGVDSTYLIIGAQLALWALSNVLFFYLANRTTENRLLALFVSVLYCASIGRLTFSFLALTETMYIAFLSASVLFLYRYCMEKGFNNLVLFLLAASGGVIVRPSGLLPYLAFLLVALAYHCRRPKAFAWLLATALPIVAQLIFSFAFLGMFSISAIGSLTLNNYLLFRAEAAAENIPVGEVRKNKNKPPHLRMDGGMRNVGADVRENLLHFVRNKPAALAEAYYGALRENMRAGCAFMRERNQGLYALSGWQNRLYTPLGLAACALLCGAAVVGVVRRRWPAKRGVLLWGTLWVLFLYNFLISGISYWQGDRFSVVNYFLALLLAGYAARQCRTWVGAVRGIRRQHR